TEMGGKNACIVTASADLARATAGIVRSAFGMGGQKCSALSRLYVHDEVTDDLLQRLVTATRALQIGDPLQRHSWLGPVTTRSGYEGYARYCELLRGDGAQILTGGEALSDSERAHGLFVAPTIATAPHEHSLWQVEMFLPILMVLRVSSNQEAM